jgi:hypothetical protein
MLPRGNDRGALHYSGGPDPIEHRRTHFESAATIACADNGLLKIIGRIERVGRGADERSVTRRRRCRSRGGLRFLFARRYGPRRDRKRAAFARWRQLRKQCQP